MHSVALTALLGAWFLWRAWQRPARSVALSFGVLALDAYNRSTFAWLAEWRLAQVLTCVTVALACVRQVYLVGWRATVWEGATAAAALLGLFVYSALSLLWTPEPTTASAAWISSLGYLATMIFGGYFVVRNEDDLDEALRETARVWTPYLVLVLLTGNWGARGIVSLIPSDHQWQGFGAGEVGYLALPTLAGICCLVLPTVPRLHATLRFVATMLLLAVIVRSGARGQLAATIAGSLLYLPSETWRRALPVIGRAIVLLAGAFVIGVVVAPSEHSQVLVRWTLDKLAAGLDVRVECITPLWAAYVDAGPVTWLFGLGADASGPIAGMAPHVVPVEVLCEYGLLGLSLLALSTWWILRDLVRVERAEGLSLALRAAIAVLVFLAVVSLKGGIFLRMPWLWAVYVMLARAAQTAANRRAQAL